MFIRNSQFIQFNYNENGDLAKKICQRRVDDRI